MNVESSITHCILCGASEAEVISRRDRHGAPLLTVTCVNCGLVRSQPIPAAAELKQFYAADYRQAYMRTYQPTPRLIHRAAMTALERWRLLKQVLQPGQNVLDIGAGGGEFVFLLRQAGWEAVGVEPNLGYSQHAKEFLGLPIEVGFAEELQIPAASYDVITLFHILEHFRDPLAIMHRVRNWLSEDGVAIVEVPNVEARCQAPDHRFHRAHLYNFNPPALVWLGRQAGFRLEQMWESDDGGTITVQLRKTDEPAPDRAAGLPGNHERIRAILRHHTALKHYCSRYPYQRPLQKIAQYWREWRETRNAPNSRELLQVLFRAATSVLLPTIFVQG